MYNALKKSAQYVIYAKFGSGLICKNHMSYGSCQSWHFLQKIVLLVRINNIFVSVEYLYSITYISVAY